MQCLRYETYNNAKKPSQPRRRREARGIQRPVERATIVRNGFGVQARAAALAHARNCLNTEVRAPEFRINPKGSPGRKKEWESQRCCEPSSGMWRPGVLHHQCPPRPALRLSGAWHQSIDAGLKCAVAGSKPGSGSGGCNAPIRIRIDLNPCCADPLQERVQAAARYAIRSSIQATRPHR